MRRMAVAMISLAVLGGAAACGGDSESGSTASSPSSHDEAHASEFSEASLLLARYCTGDPNDGVERADAVAALDTLIGIAKEYPDEEYVPAVSFREWLANPAVGPQGRAMGPSPASSIRRSLSSTKTAPYPLLARTSPSESITVNRRGTHRTSADSSCGSSHPANG